MRGLIPLFFICSVAIATAVPNTPADESPPAKVEQEKKRRASITAVTADWCGPCQKWKRECLEDLRKAGWEVRLIDDGVGPYPTFTAKNGAKVETWSGYKTRSGFMSKLREVL